MFYHNTKFKFALAEGSPSTIPGGIIAAHAMPAGQLLRRVRKDMRKNAYLQHRLFDPQMYLATLDANIARRPVVNLASHQWFAAHDVPEYDSDQHGTMKQWKDDHEDALVSTWRRSPPSDAISIAAATEAAIRYQVDLGCEAIILPSPLTTIAAAGYEAEVAWMNAGLDACRELRVSIPIYATIALSDTVLRGVDPLRHPLLHMITSQIAARDNLAGAYVVMEQTSEDGYACSTRETLLSLLLIVDDLARGAGKQSIVNYAGMFGAITKAVGAHVWSVGYYLSQRRLKLADFDERTGFAYPRFFSAKLNGDIGLESHLPAAVSSGFGDRLLTDTAASRPLRAALESGSYPAAVPQWTYRPGNITAAAAHFNEVACKVGTALHSLSRVEKIELTNRRLRESVALVDQLRGIGIERSSSTDLLHQRVWLQVFEEWRSFARM